MKLHPLKPRPPRLALSQNHAPSWPHPSPTYVQEPLVDFIDDLQVPGKQRLQEVDWPALQRLGQHRVVGVGARPHRHVPGLARAQGTQEAGAPPTRCSPAPSWPARVMPGSQTPGWRLWGRVGGLSDRLPPLPKLRRNLLGGTERGHRRGVLGPTFSQSSRSRSTRILISSGMAREGWVSLSWMATCGDRGQGSVWV